MPSFREHLAAAKQQVTEIGVDALRGLPERDARVLLDVRERDEYEEGAIPGALHVPRGKLELQIEERVPDRAAAIIVYCAGGDRSALAALSLQGLGYKDVRSLAGGYSAWKASGAALHQPFAFSSAQAARYARHFMLPEVGEAGQAKLLRSRVLLLGAGGLGSPAALYLAAAGVGTLGIVDDDVVDASNLQRQILHSTATVGLKKVDSAARTLTALNPDVTVERHPARLVATNIAEILSGYELVLDGSDNFAVRYLLNDAALAAGIPVVSASIYKFEGQVTVFSPPEGPCYRCLYPEPPPSGAVPSCAEGGVLGVLPGVLGCVQATEAVKLLLGIGRPLVGRLLQYDALEMQFREFAIPRDPRCRGCAAR